MPSFGSVASPTMVTGDAADPTWKWFEGLDAQIAADEAATDHEELKEIEDVRHVDWDEWDRSPELRHRHMELRDKGVVRRQPNTELEQRLARETAENDAEWDRLTADIAAEDAREDAEWARADVERAAAETADVAP